MTYNPSIVIPQVKIALMVKDNINYSVVIKEINNYIEKNKQINTINTNKKTDNVTSKINIKPVDTSLNDKSLNDKSVNNTSEKHNDLLNITRQSSQLQKNIHPDILRTSVCKFEKYSKIGNKHLLQLFYENAKFAIYKNHTDNTLEIGIILPPEYIIDIMKSNCKQIHNIIIAYILFMINTLDFNKIYDYPYHELFLVKKNIKLSISAFFAYSEKDYALFNTGKTYESYIIDWFICSPGCIFDKSCSYTSWTRNDDDFYDEICENIVRHFNSYISDPDHTANNLILEEIAVKVENISIIDNHRLYRAEHIINIIDDKTINMFYFKQ